MRLRGGQLPPRREPLERPGVAQDPRHEEGPARVGDEPDVDEGRDEAGGVGRDPEVAGAGERHPRARCGAVDRGDHRLLERSDGEEVGVVGRAQAVSDVAGRLAELAEVLADAEAAARAGQDDRAHFRIARLLQAPRRVRRASPC